MSSSSLYYIFVAIEAICMSSLMTTYSPFLISIGLTLGEVMLVNAAFYLMIILSEIPTGMMADGKSRAWSMKIGMLFRAISGLIYYCANGFVGSLIAEAVCGISFAFVSGADKAWITDALTREGRDKERGRVFATAQIVRGVLMIVGGFFGSFVAQFGFHNIWISEIVFSLIATVFIHVMMNGKGEPTNRMTESEALCASIKCLRKNFSLVWVILCMVVFGLVVPFNHFWSIYFSYEVDTYGLATVWSIMYSGLIIANVIVRKSKFVQGQEAKGITLAIIFSGVGLGMISLMPSVTLSIMCVIIHEIGRGAFDPLVDSFVQHRIESPFRATFGSLQSFLGRIGIVIVLFIFWICLLDKPNNIETISLVWKICGVLLVAFAFVLCLIRPRSKSSQT